MKDRGPWYELLALGAVVVVCVIAACLAVSLPMVGLLYLLGGFD